MNFSFQESYQILGITDTCDWKSFRTKYKGLIQQHHPDRYPENTPEHSQAENNIRQYNLAYKIIFEYYKENSKLPPFTSTKSETIIRVNTPRKKRPEVSQKKPHFRQATPKSKFNFIKSPKALLFITISTIFLLQAFLADPTQDEQHLPTETTHNSRPLVPTITKNHTTAPPSNNESTTMVHYFSLGSTLGEVILAQGKPTKVKDNVWYYGESTITFTNGLVSEWYRHPTYPLQAKLKETPPNIYSGTQNKTKKETNNLPYWSR